MVTIASGAIPTSSGIRGPLPPRGSVVAWSSMAAISGVTVTALVGCRVQWLLPRRLKADP